MTQESQDPLTSSLSHVTEGVDGPRARMVDVSHKHETHREATARAIVEFPEGLLGGILREGGPKGPVLEVARIAGVGAAKQTGLLIPLCHPLGLDGVDVEIRQVDENRLEVLCTAVCTGRTGVEMEAMTGASVAALTLYDMTKALSKGITIQRVELLAKSGGKSGPWKREG
ncbi:MAG: cyclic pyranopterin monophosphate synthase MoaC [Planctomycetota bacterium]|nr:cyclic pyranopterin monophosphate synthase MoaC [Planctomycetota bacterium]